MERRGNKAAAGRGRVGTKVAVYESGFHGISMASSDPDIIIIYRRNRQ